MSSFVFENTCKMPMYYFLHKLICMHLCQSKPYKLLYYCTSKNWIWL